MKVTEAMDIGDIGKMGKMRKRREQRIRTKWTGSPEVGLEGGCLVMLSRQMSRPLHGLSMPRMSLAGSHLMSQFR